VICAVGAHKQMTDAQILTIALATVPTMITVLIGIPHQQLAFQRP
jgi:hypothetical protein